MKWTQAQPGTPLLTLDDVKEHLRLIDGQDDGDYIAALVAAATAHAEQAMACSLITRAVTATFYSGENLYLPRGPVQSITSVQVGGQTVSPSAYSTEQYGHSTLLRFNNGTIQPLAAPATLVVTYQAGYGPTATDVPADIVAAVRCHVGLLYENRESAADRTVTPVPFIDSFYKLRSLDGGVG